MLALLCSLLLARLILSSPATNHSPKTPRDFFRRGGLPSHITDPYDRTWINSLTSVGDSYSVGLGAGHAVKGTPQMELNTDCYQYSYGYPILVNMDGMIGENSQRHFQYLGCSGALTNEIKNNQVPKMQKSQAVLVSAGGNDAHLAVILNYCVYQWFTIWGWSCEGELSSGESEIQSAGYFKGMTDMLTAIESKLLDENSRIYWSGYMRFFDDTSNDCDDVTWSLTGNFGFRQYLTRDRRTQFNQLVDQVNEKIQAACNTVSRCVYVDSEKTNNWLRGRFCEPGINEHYYGGIDSPVDGWNREKTVFYEWSTTKDDDDDDDKDVDQPEKRDIVAHDAESFVSLESRNDRPGGFDNSSFEGNIANWIQKGITEKTLNTSAANIGEVNAQWLPDWIGRCFHLTKFGNAIVANNVNRAMIAEQAKMMNQKADPIEVDLGACLASAASPSPVAPYELTGGSGDTAGKCHVHVKETEDCEDDKHNLATEVTIWDVGGKQIGYQSSKEAGATDPLSVKSKLEAPLILTPENRGDYVQFALGTEAFNSQQNDRKALSWCDTGGWDPREGPSCVVLPSPSNRQMDCYFQCPYHGGKSSDGS